ncbi:hypothetical protein BGZ58_002321 [Dissophora ornata]|nr:hypothetical protein BGZ58_002321 [Dissophora ornata]
MPLSFSRPSLPKQSFINRVFSNPSSSSSSSSRPHKAISSSSAKNSNTPFMNRFRRAPPPSTMDKLQAKLNPNPDATPASIAASKRKAKKAKAKEASHKRNPSSFFRRH